MFYCVNIRYHENNLHDDNNHKYILVWLRHGVGYSGIFRINQEGEMRAQELSFIMRISYWISTKLTTVFKIIL